MTENQAQTVIPLKCNISNFYINLNANAGTSASSSYIFNIRKNGVDTGLSITIPFNGSSGSNIINNVTFNSGDLFSISAVPSTISPTDNIDVRWSARMTPIA